MNVLILHDRGQGKVDTLFNNLTVLLPPLKETVAFLRVGRDPGDWPVYPVSA